jgi:hypothetical protein
MERFGLEDWPPLEQLAPKEAQARFKSLVLDIMSTLAQIKGLSEVPHLRIAAVN